MFLLIALPALMAATPSAPDALKRLPCALELAPRIGQKLTARQRGRLTAAGRLARILEWRDMATADVREDRLTVRLGRDGRVERVGCD